MHASPFFVQSLHAPPAYVDKAGPASRNLAVPALPEQQQQGQLEHVQQQEHSQLQQQHALHEVTRGHGEGVQAQGGRQGWPGQGQQQEGQGQVQHALQEVEQEHREAEQEEEGMQMTVRASACEEEQVPCSVVPASAAPSVQEDVPTAPANAKPESSSAASSAPDAKEPEEEEGLGTLPDLDASTAMSEVGVGNNSGAFGLPCMVVAVADGTHGFPPVS